jgi:hypothetical protein
MIDTLREVVTRNGCGTGEGASTAEDVIDGPGCRRGTTVCRRYLMQYAGSLR